MYEKYISNNSISEFNDKYEYYYKNCILNMTEQVLSHYIGKDFCEVLNSYCLLIIKPECIAFNKIHKLIEILKNYKFELVYFKEMLMSQTQIYALWEYSWKNVAYEHIYVNKHLLSIGKSIVIILKNNINSRANACEFITSLKGSAYAEKRLPYHIRTHLEPLNISLNYIHSSDTIFDFVYEMGILFSIYELKRIINAIKKQNIIDYAVLLKGKYRFNNIDIQQDICLQQKINEIQKIAPQEKHIIKKLKNILYGNDYFDMNLIFEMEDKHLLTWNWTWMLIVSSYTIYKGAISK